MTKQIKIGGEWVEGDPTMDKQEYRLKIPAGDLFGYQYGKHSLSASDPIQYVGIAALGELVPDAVRSEIRGLALDGGISAAKRKAAGRIITRLNSNEQIDAFGSELTDLLSKLVTHTVLTPAQSNAILEALQS